MSTSGVLVQHMQSQQCACVATMPLQDYHLDDPLDGSLEDQVQVLRSAFPQVPHV